MWRCLLGNGCKNEGFRDVHKLLSGRNQIMKCLREAHRWGLPTYISREHLYSFKSTSEAYFSGWSSRTSRGVFFTDRLEVSVNLLPMQCPGCGSPKLCFWLLESHWAQECKPLWTQGSGNQGALSVWIGSPASFAEAVRSAEAGVRLWP